MRFMTTHHFLNASRLKGFSAEQLARCFMIVLVLPILATAVYAQDRVPLPPPGELKRLSIEELMSVEVTSVSRRPERLSQVPSAIQVITREAIRRSGASSLPEALRLASNLQVAQTDPRRWAVSARGFNSPLANKLLVLIDGRTVYSPLFAGVFWDLQQVLLEDIERIEVISGPGGTLWGVNAVNGVINIITRSAKDTQGLFVEGGGGTELRGFGSARYGAAPKEGLYVRAYGRYSDRGSIYHPDGRRADDRWGMGQGGFRLDWEASSADRLTLQGDLYTSRLAQAGEDLVNAGGNVTGHWSHTRPNGSNVSVQMYFDGVHRADGDSFDDMLYTYDLDFQHYLSLGERHNFVWGAGIRQVDDNLTPGDLALVPQEKTLLTISTFVQDEFALLPNRLLLTVGTKLEHTEYTGFELQPNARLAWTPNMDHTVWGALSRAVRTPSRLDRGIRAPGFSGSSDFDSEKLVAYELGYRVSPFEDVSLSLATFYHDYDDIRSTELDLSAVPPLVIGNGQEGETYGAELTARYQARPWWRLRAGYTLLRVDIRPKSDSSDPTSGANEAADPDHQLLLFSSLDLPGRIEFDTILRYVSRITNPNARVPGYAEVDVRVGWQPTPNLEVSIVGQNLLHDHHPEFATTGLEPERGIYAKVAWRH